MKKLRRIATFAMALVLAFAMGITVLASSVVSISDARTGVIQVELKYVDQAGNEHPIKSGTAFLIDEKYAITNYHVVHMTQDEKAQATENFNVDFVNTTVSGLKLFVVVRRDMTIEVTEVNGSAESDFSILKLSQALKDRTYLPLGSNSDISEAETVYALGFPGLADAFTDAQYYTSDDVNITSGIVNKKITDNGVPYIQHSAELSGGNSGGPLLNEDGVVVGVNRSSVTYENDSSVVYNRSIDISEIRTYLDSLGIPYQDAAELAQVEPEPVPTQPSTSTQPTEDSGSEEPVATVDKSSLQKAIDQVNKVSADDYTEDSVKAMNEALEDAEKVYNKADATQQEVDDAEDALRNAIRSLEEKQFPIVLVAVIGGVVLLVIVLIIVLVAVSGSKKKKKAAEAERVRREEMMRQQTAAQRPQGQMPPQMPRPQPQPVNRPYTPSPMTAPAEGAGETSVLNNGAGETTVLGGQGRPTATLSRAKTGEKVSVAKQVFTIGKERRKVDFCIADNTSVSREHAQIICRGADYYVVDKNSTNFTFVNGNKIQPGQEILLKDGDKIKLADEEFEFKMS